MGREGEGEMGEGGRERTWKKEKVTRAREALHRVGC